ncbi:unnamed protein product, partial [marine sediment metagenome]
VKNGAAGSEGSYHLVEDRVTTKLICQAKTSR